METKDKIKVLFSFNADGYITGYQSEFWDGERWQTPFDTTSAVDVAPADLASLVLGATKLTGVKLVLDAAKQAELAKAEAPVPTAQDELNAHLLKQTAQNTLVTAAIVKQLAAQAAKEAG